MNQSDFCLGFFFGFLFAGILGFVFNQIRAAQRRITDGKPQRAAAYSERSPREEVSRSNAARLEVFLLVLVLIAVVIGFLWLMVSLLS
jgi:hypothetical protein